MVGERKGAGGGVGGGEKEERKVGSGVGGGEESVQVEFGKKRRLLSDVIYDL
jgi:hypothetical protein